MIKRIAFVCALLASPQAGAYCIQNQLTDRDVAVEQEHHPDFLRDERRMRATLKPGESTCCKSHELDCNPLGRDNSVVNLAITLPGEPLYECAFPPGAGVKVTGSGTIRILPNPNKKSSNPYIVRIGTNDKDLTGPSGVPCLEPKPKGTK
jgi:hypothetical protein